MIGAGQVMLGGGIPTQACDSADFDGTNDYMTTGATLTGIADGKTGSISYWTRLDGSDGNTLFILANATTLAGGSTRFNAQRGSTNTFSIRGNNAAAGSILNIRTSNTYLAGATWYNVLASWDLATPGSGRLYINDVSDYVETTYTNDTIDYTVADWGAGGMCDGTLKADACLAELWFTTTYIDFSIVANRRKFITVGGKPAVLGATGANPTGTAPLVYQRLAVAAAASNFATNLGSGGNFTITGTLTTGSTSPSS